MRQSNELFVEPVDPVDLGDSERLNLGLLDPSRQRPDRGRGVAHAVQRQQDLRDPAPAQLGAAMRAVARLLPRQGFGESRREPPHLLEPPRDHPAPVQHGPKPAADDASLDAAVPHGVPIVVGQPAVPMGGVPDGNEDPFEPIWNRER